VVAYASFVWLISNSPALTATTYTYVTPAVALLLGWLVLGERVTPAVFISAAAVCVGVATVLVGESRGTAAGDRPA
jgi:drug/metabolite transporter (DMT)-like permease